MVRNSVQVTTLPNVDSTLARCSPVYSVVSTKHTTLTSTTALAAIPPLNVCMTARKTLYAMNVDDNHSELTVVTWPGYGTFSQEGIQDIVRLHNAKQTKLEINNKEKWFAKLCSELSGSHYKPLLEDLNNFKSAICNSESEDLIYNTGLKVETLCKIACNRWLNDEIIGCVFEMLNRGSREHFFVVVTEALLYSAKAQQNLSTQISRKVQDGPQYLHFALNVRKSANGAVSLGNGNHWTYFVCNASLSELFMAIP